MQGSFALLGVSAFAALVFGSAVGAQDASYGALIYKENCMVCHGETGAGDGMVGMLFEKKPADLKLLKQGNNGVFPREEAIEAIYGRRPIQAHGQTEMPIWGRYFMKEALESRAIDPADAAMIVQGRVLSVISYLESIQVE